MTNALRVPSHRRPIFSPLGGLALAFGLVGPAFAQGGPHLDPATGTAINPMPFPVAMLIVHNNQAGITDNHEILRVDPNGTAHYTLPPNSTLFGTMLLDPAIPLRQPPSCPAGARRMALSNALAREKISITRGAVNKNMDATENAAQQVANVQTAEAVDTMNTALTDPATAARYQMLKDAAATPADAQAVQTAQNTEMAMDMVAGGLGAAMANGAVIQAHSEQSQKEADSLKEILDSSKKTLVDIEAGYTKELAIIAAQRDFEEKSAAIIGSTVNVSVEVPRGTELGRLCSGAANDKDTLQLQLAAPADVATLMARAHFDHGGEESLIFHRITGTPQWVSTVYWPLDSSKASVTLHSSNAWIKIGEVTAQRDSVEKQVADAKKSIGTLKKAHRQAAYAGQGGDENRTVIVP